jgi:hypothetical protein
MNTSTLKSQSRIKSTALRTTCWLAGGALISGACGAVFGLVFGGLEMLLLGDALQIPNVVLYFAACGMAAGALLGAFGALIEREDLAAVGTGDVLQTKPSAVDLTMSRSELPRFAQDRELENRLRDVPAVNLRQKQRLAERTPSRN